MMLDWGQRLRKIQDSIQQVMIDQAAMKEDLRHHIKRSDKLEAEVEPIKRHVNNVEGVFKLVGLLALVSAIAGSIFAILK